MSEHRNVTMNVHGVKLLIEVLPRSKSHPAQTPRRWCVRQAQPKDSIDQILDAGVLSEIDKRIRGGEYDEPEDAAEIPFDVPTPAGGAI
jgi:hypothetical protein